MTGPGGEWREISLPHGLDAPAIARRWLLDEITADLHLAEDAALLVSELVTNAVLYGEPEATARMRQATGTIEVVVTDRGEMSPTMPAATPAGVPDPNGPGGRGLFMVASLASEWGIEPLRPGPGKAVWFRLDAHR